MLLPLGTSVANLNGSKDRDLALLQRLLDENIVSGNQTSELQAMGIVMGDLLASELSSGLGRL